MLKPKYTKQFKKDLKKIEHQNNTMQDLKKIINKLLKKEPLTAKLNDHPLMGKWAHHRECHDKPDMLLIYKTSDKFLFLERLGSHSELFD